MPEFGFDVPAGYYWLIERQLAGFEPNSALQPWFLLPHDEAFWVSERWPHVNGKNRLCAFARRQDCDDLACFEVDGEGKCREIVVVHAWTPEGYIVVRSFESFWEWMKSTIDEIEEWVDSAKGE